MITKVIMPQMSLTMQFGIVSKWLKSPGDSVIVGEPMCTVEGDKAAVDIEAPATGILMRIVAKEGAEFPVKQVMAYIGDPGDVIKEEAAATDNSKQAPVSSSGEMASKPDSKLTTGRINASPVAKRLAQEKGIDLAEVTGTGPDGLIGKEDVLAFKGTDKSSASNEKTRELNTIEKIIAERMAQSNQEIPHFHLTTSCNLNKANKLRKDTNQKNTAKNHITLTDLVIWSVSRSLKKYPDLNASYQPNMVVFNPNINVGLAVDTPNGLLVVVLKNTDKMSIFEIAEKREELAQRAVKGKQTPDDLSEGTFTISNLGMYGIESFDPIITPGQVGILGVGALANSLEMDDKGTVHSVEKLTLTLGCDHRAVDGVAGAEFLSEIKQNLEKSDDIFK